jgi:outer membrane lipoprotein SlyB
LRLSATLDQRKIKIPEDETNTTRHSNHGSLGIMEATLRSSSMRTWIMTNKSTNDIAAGVKAVFVTAVLMCGLLVIGCETQGQSGALLGAGIGALAGQAIGGDTGGTLIGAAVGGGVGYMIGNKKDKKHAAELSETQQASNAGHNEVGPLGSTRWLVTSINPRDAAGAYTSKIIYFQPDGRVATTTTKPDGRVEVANETYRVVGNTLIINKPGYLINARFAISGKQLTVSAEDFSVVLTSMQ